MTSRPSPGPRWRRPAHVAWVVDDGTAVLLHLPSGRRMALSDTGTAVWQALVEAGDDGVAVADLTPALAERYHANPDQVAADVAHLLTELAAQDLAELSP